MPSGFSDSLGFLRSEHFPSSGTPLGHSVPSIVLHVERLGNLGMLIT